MQSVLDFFLVPVGSQRPSQWMLQWNCRHDACCLRMASSVEAGSAAIAATLAESQDSLMLVLSLPVCGETRVVDAEPEFPFLDGAIEHGNDQHRHDRDDHAAEAGDGHGDHDVRTAAGRG
jgi:hypothetical protein